MSILRGFGFTFDIATGRNRQWYVDDHGVRHYLDEQEGEQDTHPQEGGEHGR